VKKVFEMYWMSATIKQLPVQWPSMYWSLQFTIHQSSEFHWHSLSLIVTTLRLFF
jgi:hypothetical protein